MNNPILIGCIADDFTGASDAASFLVKGGLDTVLYNGIPDSDISVNSQAVVIALKTRSQEVPTAIEDSLRASTWLKGKNAQQLFIKYASTFDSTPQGNIGPICDAILDRYQISYTILCPSLPVNDRVVKAGKIYVKGVPLADSPMKDHPLNPMWESEVAKLMDDQSKYPSFNIGKQTSMELQQTIDQLQRKNDHFYLVPDYENNTDAENIVSSFRNLPLLTGGSGILEVLASSYLNRNPKKKSSSRLPGPTILLAGSCSQATLAQIKYYQDRGGASLKIEPLKLLKKQQTLTDIIKYIKRHAEKSVLVYSSDSKKNIERSQPQQSKKVARLIEDTLAKTAQAAQEIGYRKIIVAGGETSGAVTKKLGFSSYYIGESVAPGVPVMTPVDYPDIRLVLKSGNFGQENFFCQSIKQLAAK